ncbi:MAG: hypothetical protein LBT24_01535 [Tannerella sp.]|jgi:hypothetical protein|nr:hypothetical protein [Tannerella sp.]
MKKKLKENYEKACNDYARAFCDKHGYDYSETYWVGTPGSILSVCDYDVDMETIIQDIELEAKKEEFLRWYDYCLRLGMLSVLTPNFSSWVRGCPRRSEKEIKKLEDKKKRIEELKNELEKLIEDERI